MLVMVELGRLVEKVRSKNAGPFWLTIDVFCSDEAVFRHVSDTLETRRVAEIFRVDADDVKRFDIASLNVVKFSFPRPVVQGTRRDRDMHGAQWGILLEELAVPDLPDAS
jgi:hypothetical protein